MTNRICDVSHLAASPVMGKCYLSKHVYETIPNEINAATENNKRSFQNYFQSECTIYTLYIGMCLRNNHVCLIL